MSLARLKWGPLWMCKFVALHPGCVEGVAFREICPPSNTASLRRELTLTGRGRGHGVGKYLEFITLCLGGQHGEGDAIVSLKNAALTLHYVLEQRCLALDAVHQDHTRGICGSTKWVFYGDLNKSGIQDPWHHVLR